MQIYSIKFFNAVKIGGKEATFITANENTKISLINNHLIKVEQFDYVTYTSLFNVPWFNVEQDKKISDDKVKAGVKPTNNGKAPVKKVASRKAKATKNKKS